MNKLSVRLSDRWTVGDHHKDITVTWQKGEEEKHRLQICQYNEGPRSCLCRLLRCSSRGLAGGGRELCVTSSSWRSVTCKFLRPFRRGQCPFPLFSVASGKKWRCIYYCSKWHTVLCLFSSQSQMRIMTWELTFRIVGRNNYLKRDWVTREIEILGAPLMCHWNEKGINYYCPKWQTVLGLFSS